MDVLACLAAHPGRLVPKEELLETVWGGVFVEEGALSQTIHSLRKALGDDARQPRYVQTVPKRGYRLVASVLPLAEPGQTAAAVEAAPSLPRAPEPARSPEIPARKSRRAWLLVLALAAPLLLLLLWNPGSRLRQPPEAAVPETGATRIVVLPFENLGQPEDAFFADGLTEEITKDLASLSSLQVISRTSAMLYAGVRKPLPEIGRELRVAYVLEGTVRWAEGPEGRPRVRITPQLIRVADDAHLWAESFDREVEDIFQVQAEISRRVLSQLGVTLRPEERQALQQPPTENLEAYGAYLRGLELRNQPFYSEEHVRRAASMFERALQLDPDFAIAWAELSQTHSYLAYNSDPSPGRVERARQALDRALELDPDALPVRLAQAYFTYRCLEDFAAAHRQLAATAQRFPNNAEVLQTLGFVLRRQGRLTEAVSALQRAFSLDPKTVKLVWTIAETYRALREYEQADRYYSQAVSLAPDQPSFWEDKALNRLAWTGEVAEARAVLREAPVLDHPRLLPVQFQLDFYERDYRGALSRLSPERLQEIPLQQQSWLALLSTIAYERMGDRPRALQVAAANLGALEARVARFPKEPIYRSYFAVALAQLGRKDEALAQAEQAVRQRRQDAFTGPYSVETQALVDTILGRRTEAVHRLSGLLAKPYQYSLCSAELRLNPIWDPLRGDRRFEDLLHRPED